MGNLLEIRNLCIEAGSNSGSTPIVRDVSMDLKRGEVIGLIGESGAGKTTFGLTAMGHVRPGCRITGGSINLDGTELVGASASQLRHVQGRRVAYVAQSAAAAFNPAWRLLRQHCEGPVHHGLMTRRQASSDAMRLYSEMRLPEPDRIGFRFPHQVSGGQLQRVMTAMAMACRPDLIIFDEPTTALDVTTQIKVLATIRNIVRDRNVAAIYITHDLAVVAQMADRIKVLLKGEEVEEAKTEDMLSNPREDYTKSLWAVRDFRPAPRLAETSPTPLLQLKSVSAAYGKQKVLDDITISVPRGRTVALVGESGSGKSTTARAVMGLLPLQSGSILFDGAPLPPSPRLRSRDMLRRIQMIHQMADTALNPRHKVREILGRPLEFYLGLQGRQQEDRVRQLLTEIELEPDDFIDRLPGDLSGGQKQRLCIARALAAKPDLIICDEVTSALDQLVAEGILRLLDRLQREQDIGFLFITHDLATVRAIADHVVVMQHGQLVEQGAKDDIFAPPHKPYTELLLASVPDMDPRWLDRVLEKDALISLA